MSEVVESRAAESSSSSSSSPRSLPLAETHARDGAVLREFDGWLVPAHYGDRRAEYEAVRSGEGAGLFDLSPRGRVEVSGSEAVRFLNGMVTNDVALLEDGAWMHAAFPNVQGRLIARARVLGRGDVFLFDTEPATREKVIGALERFTLAGDFFVKDLSAETALLSLQGARASEMVRAFLGDEVAPPERGRIVVVPRGEGQPLTVMRATHTSEDGFDLFVPSSEASATWDALVEAGARPAGCDALEVLRVEAGEPRFGVDVDETNVVLEAVRENEAVSYTKGCYVGQEIIARIHWRGHVAKRLAGLVFETDAGDVVGAKLKSPGADREVGRITSAVLSPHLGRTVALAVIKYDFLAHGTELEVHGDESKRMTATVSDLPTVRGSWYVQGEDAEEAGA